MTPEHGKIPDWARRESQEDSAWIVEDLDVFWLFASRAFNDTGRGAIVVDTRIQPIPGAGHPVGYFSHCPDGQRGDGRYSTRAAAELLNVGVSTIAAWCRSGRLDGIRATPRGHWWIKLTPEIVAELRKPVRQRWENRSSK